MVLKLFCTLAGLIDITRRCKALKLFSGKDTDIAKEKKVEEIILQNYDSYYRLAYSYVHNEADAGDIVQNGAYRAIRSSHKLKQDEYAATWVYRIMQNEIFRLCNEKKTEVVSLDEIPVEQGREDVYSNMDLQRALDLLYPEDKAIVELRFFENRKLEEIAQILDENVSTVKSRLYRSMKKLRIELE